MMALEQKLLRVRWVGLACKAAEGRAVLFARPPTRGSSFEPGNAIAVFRESFLAGSARARKPGRHHRTWMKRLPDSWWLGEAIGDDPQSWRVEAKANMGGIDLDVFPLAALLLQARPPGDHPVGARVDRR